MDNDKANSAPALALQATMMILICFWVWAAACGAQCRGTAWDWQPRSEASKYLQAPSRLLGVGCGNMELAPVARSCLQLVLSAGMPGRSLQHPGNQDSMGLLAMQWCQEVVLEYRQAGVDSLHPTQGYKGA